MKYVICGMLTLTIRGWSAVRYSTVHTAQIGLLYLPISGAKSSIWLPAKSLEALDERRDNTNECVRVVLRGVQHLLVSGARHAVLDGRDVSDEREAHHTNVEGARHDRLVRRAHAHEVGAERAQHAALGDRLVSWPAPQDVRALHQRHLLCFSARQKFSAQLRVVRVRHWHERLGVEAIIVQAVKRVATVKSREVDLIAKNNQLTFTKCWIQGATCISEEKRTHSQLFKNPDIESTAPVRMPLWQNIWGTICQITGKLWSYLTPYVVMGK